MSERRLRLRMLRSRFWILIFLMIFTYLITNLLQNTCKQPSRKGLVKIDEYLRMKSKLSELQNTVRLLQATVQQEGCRKSQLLKRDFNLTENLDRPSTHKLANDVQVFEDLVTVILYRDKKTPYPCLQAKENYLRQKYSKLKILTPHKNINTTIGSQFNSFIDEVKTPYFFFLNTRHDLLDHGSDNSAGWLLHALEKVPELDFVSGSILDGGKLEIPCYKMKLCNWTLSQRYEYSRSIGELMICENIATSFMGKVNAVKRIRSRINATLFDENLILMATTDFFLTAKQEGAVSGVRPEVFFQVSNHTKCKTNSKTNRRQKYRNLLPFAHKHKVFRFRDPDLNELDLCERDTSPIVGEDICDEKVAHKIMLGGGHWAYDGTFAYPFILNNLQNCFQKVVSFLTSQNVSFHLSGGVSLGAIKMRAVLPWEAGDVDMNIIGLSQDQIYKLMSDFALKSNFTAGLINTSGVSLFCTSPALSMKIGGVVTMFITDLKNTENLKMKINGRWVSQPRHVFRDLRNAYGVNYLQHKLYHSQEFLHCKKTGHNACLPDFRTSNENSGKTGTSKEHFCSL